MAIVGMKMAEMEMVVGEYKVSGEGERPFI